MSEDTQIPLLQDLIHKGRGEDEQNETLAFDENQALEIEQEEYQTEQQPEKHSGEEVEEWDDDPNTRELMINEEIRMILDKHMDKAYEEIIRLLNHRIS